MTARNQVSYQFDSGFHPLKDATNAALRDWMETSHHTQHIIGSVIGPHPRPMIVLDFQSMIGVEVDGRSNAVGEHAAPISAAGPGVLYGSLSYVLQDHDGQTAPIQSLSAGLDHPGIGPEHAHWADSSRVEYASVTDEETLKAFKLLTELEGVIPALESSHAVHDAVDLASKLDSNQTVVVNLPGRGDKDLDEVIRLLWLDSE